MGEEKVSDIILCKKCGDDITSSRKGMKDGNYYCLGCYSNAIVSPSNNSINSANKLKEPTTNTIGNIIKIIGFCVMFVGFVVGALMEKELGSYSYTFEIKIALPFWIAGFISGTIFIGVAEIINLLHKIHEKL